MTLPPGIYVFFRVHISQSMVNTSIHYTFQPSGLGRQEN
jgi:hypothetical protein